MNMVRDFVLARGIREPWVLRAMEKVPRHLFVDEALRQRAYGDYALPIGVGQTISQPYTIAVTSWALGLKGGERVLEVGTGSGYQTAVLAEIAEQVFSMERVSSIALRARRTLDQLGYLNISIRTMDGFFGLKEEAPFDAILISAAAASFPMPLMEQLKPGGRIVLPLEEKAGQQLLQLEKGTGTWKKRVLGPCRFVPLRGTHPD